MAFKIEWIDDGREPQCLPDPDYPNGIDIVAASPGARSCTVDLPYPAKRCGKYIVECSQCGVRIGVTTAGRHDDPRSLTMPCKESLH